MLDQNLKTQVTGLFNNLKSSFTFKVLVSDTHSKREELLTLLNEVSECSDKVNVEVEKGDDLRFSILKDGVESGFQFRAVPNGHEFSTLLLAIINMEGLGKNLPDEALSARIKSLKGDITIKSYISLSCINCPDVVQAINIMSILNPNIKHEIVDGSINQEEVDKLNIQSVPTVYAEGEVLQIGKSNMGELLVKLEEKFGKKEATVVADKKYDVVIAGGGPAGVSSAIYSARKGLSVALVAEKIGGQVTETVDIENMISVPKTTGKQLSSNMNMHLNDYEIDVLDNRLVKNVELVNGEKHIETSLGEKLITPAMIIATGASWRKLNVPGEEKYIGSGVAFCTHCDGPFYKGKKVIVVGGGNSGLEAAIDLSAIASEVTVLEYLDELKGDKVLQDKLAEQPNVNIITGVETKEILGDGEKVTSLKYRDLSSGEEKELDVDGVFVQIGLKPNSQVFKDVVEVNKFGEIEIDAGCKTSTPGIYAAGDVSVVPFKQIVVAMGEGSKAALSAFEDRIKGLQVGLN